MKMINRCWVLKRRPLGDIDPGNLEIIERELGPLGEGQIRARTLLLSLDPTNRVWMSDRDQYMPPVGIGDVMRGGTIALVEESRSPRFAPGDFVMPSDARWELYAVADAKHFRRVDRLEGVPLSAHLSVLGATGLTAYFGMTDICRPAAGEVVAISAAAGAVGSVAGQIARLHGAQVVGIAGGEEKCEWITRGLGFDHAIDYKAVDVGDELDRLCPEGVDINFENVGGPIMDAVFSRLRQNGRMALCGMISAYNTAGPLAGPTDFGRILMKRLTVRGFIVPDYLSQFRMASEQLGKWVSNGDIQWRDHIVEGLENAVDALGLLFEGANTGKLLVRVSEHQ